MVPIWLILSNIELHAFLSFASCTYSVFLTSKSSPTKSTSHPLLNSFQLSQSFSEKGSSSNTIGYFSSNERYNSLSCFGVRSSEVLPLNPRSYFPSRKNSLEAGSIANLTLSLYPQSATASVRSSRASWGCEIGGANPLSSPTPAAYLLHQPKP